MKNIGILILVMGSVITVSNVLVNYPLGQWLTYAAFTYPLVFLITDIANRRYGVRGAGIVATSGFIVAIICSLIASHYTDVVTLRVAVGSGIAFFIAQSVDITSFHFLRKMDWWKTPMISSVLGSVCDTFIFFWIAFSLTTFHIAPDYNDWAQELKPVLGVGQEYAWWVSLAVADLGVKLILIPLFLIPYRKYTT